MAPPGECPLNEILHNGQLSITDIMHSTVSAMNRFHCTSVPHVFLILLHNRYHRVISLEKDCLLEHTVLGSVFLHLHGMYNFKGDGVVWLFFTKLFFTKLIYSLT